MLISKLEDNVFPINLKKTIIFAYYKNPNIRRMDETKALVDNIIEGCQDKKARSIVTVDLTELPGAISKYFVICEGNTPTQVSAIADQVLLNARKKLSEKPITLDGLNEARWVGIDYGTVIVHIFIPELREFYDLEHLWADAKVEHIPDID